MQFVDISLPAQEPRHYDVVIGLGMPDAVADDLVRMLRAPRWAVISDTNVGPLYGEPLAAALRAAGADADCLTFPAGEAAKTRETVAELQDRLIERDHDRHSWVVAVGGGVVGDLAGFVAATLFRGIPHVQVPTTLLAMVDSSVGGKTGVDTPAGKNLVGAFLQPRRVLVAPSCLQTLPAPELAAGVAEVIKYGVILDADLFESLEEGLLEEVLGGSEAAVARIVARCCDLKSGVVAADETEAGYRKILNFGHTVGHAIETVLGFAIRHGEAVAIGMVAEARLAAATTGAPTDLAARIEGLCRRAGLPTELPQGCDPAAVVAATIHDKKARAGAAHCALPAALGSMSERCGDWSIAVEAAALEAAIRG